MEVETFEGKQGEPVNLALCIVGSAIIILLQIDFVFDSIRTDCCTDQRTKKALFLRLAIGIFMANIFVSIIQIIQSYLCYQGLSGVTVSMMAGAIISSIIAALLYH